MKNSTTKTRFDSKARHIRWNHEQSPDNPELVRYHIIIVDDKDREGKLTKTLRTMQEKVAMNYSFEEIRKTEGQFVGTEYRYLFVSYDTAYSPKLFGPSEVSKNLKQDSALRERKRGNIEDYVANLYSEKKSLNEPLI